MSIRCVRRRRLRALRGVLHSLALLLWAFVAAPLLRASEIDFSRDIRPILSDNCFFCHGPDAKRREADLRLDQRESALAVVKAGDSAASELIRRITSSDPDELMPPPKSHRELTAAQKELIARWIDAGAAWGDHWAFRPLVKPQPPSVPAEIVPADQPVAPIDAFVLAELARQGLAPAPEAPRAAILRRVSLDLAGLPPTPDQTRAFVADPDPWAYEKAVDRLLASPAFGERMAWEWLDAARYADTNGYQGDNERTMWPWRDWVVEAFNRNLPYDQFTIWQLAGDLLPGSTLQQKLATGFCRNHMINGEGGRIDAENRVDYVMDMAETTATVWLGLTTNCCRCHDHKFDPLTQRDYYGLFGFFNQTPVTGGERSGQSAPLVEIPSDEQQRDIADLEGKIAGVKRQLDARAAELAKDSGAWEERLATAAGANVHWIPLKPLSADAEHQNVSVQSDDSILVGGQLASNDTYVVNVTITSELAGLRAVRLEALRDPSLTASGLSRSDSGNFVLTEFEVTYTRVNRPGVKPAKIASALATFEQSGFKVEGAFDGKPQTGWAVWDGHPVDQEQEAVFLFTDPLTLEPGSILTFTLRHDSQHAYHNLGHFRLSATKDANAQPLRPAQRVVAALRKEPAARSKEERTLAAQGLRQIDESYRKLSDEEQRYRDRLSAVRKSVVKVMVMEDMTKPRQTFMLERGIYNKPGEEVTSATPGCLPPLPAGESANRLALARWLVSADQPLAPRVTVNRLWQQLFGVGLVKTTEDFGVQGEMPKHMELLDWLAADFRDSGWDVKRLVRAIVTSRTYRQSSRVTPELAERDPQNRLLARGPRFRIPSWMIRDQALAASGLLAPRVGGPPVNGYQPEGVWEEATFGNKRYQQDHGEALYRRSLYTFWRRIIGPTMFFDNAARQTCTVKTLRTNTPLHALLTLNDVTYVEAARGLAQRALTTDVPGGATTGPTAAGDTAAGDAAAAALGAAAGDRSEDAARLDLAFERVLCRSASAAERTILLTGLARSRAQFQADPDAAQQLLAVGESPRDARLDFVEHASWTALCLAILNLDEALTKE